MMKPAVARITLLVSKSRYIRLRGRSFVSHPCRWNEMEDENICSVSQSRRLQHSIPCQCMITYSEASTFFSVYLWRHWRSSQFQHAPVSQVLEGERLQGVVFIQLTSVSLNAIHKLDSYQITVPLGTCSLKTALQRDWAIFCRIN